MRHFVYLYAFSLCLFAPGSALCDQAQNEANEHTGAALHALRAWKSSADAVWSYDIHADVVVRTLSGEEYIVIAEHRIRQRFLHGKWRVDLLRTHRRFADGTEHLWEAQAEVKAFAYNGSLQPIRYFSSREPFGEIKSPGASAETRVKLLAPQLFEAFKSHYYGESYFSMLEYRSPSATATIDAERIELQLPRTGTSAPHNFAKDDFVIHLSPNSGFLPTLIRSGRDLNGSPEVISEILNDVAEVDRGIWIPVRSTKRVFATAIAGNVETPISEEELIVDLEQSRFNIDIHPEAFELAFPPEL